MPGSAIAVTPIAATQSAKMAWRRIVEKVAMNGGGDGRKGRDETTALI
jgi:hypothetical protein